MSTKMTTPLEWWGVDQLCKLRQHRPDIGDSAGHHLLQSNEELRWSVVMSAYQDRQINLGKAAELLGVHEVELRERFLALGIPLRLGPEDLSEARAEIAAIRTWLAEDTKTNTET